MSDASVDELWAAPPEILALVFRFLSHELPITPHHAPYHTDFAGHQEPDMCSTWVKTTWVSRYWRAVALSDTSLWTNISTAHGAAWADTLLKRSGRRNVFLHLGACELDELDDPVWMEAASRAHTIQIGSTSNRSEWHKRLLDIDAKFLATFRIQLHHEDVDLVFEEECPERFFKSTPSELRQLELCGFFSYELSFLSLYPTLTRLKLGILSEYDWTGVGPIELLLSVLSQLQQLRELTLLGLEAHDTTMPAFDQYADSVDLPHLQHLHLENCPASTMSDLFNAIVISADNAKLRIIAHPIDWDEFPSPIGEFTTVVERRLSAGPWRELQAVAISPTEHSSNYIQLSSPTDSDCFAVSAWRTNPDAHNIFCNWDRGLVPTHEPDLYLSLPMQLREVEDYPDRIISLFGQPSVHTLLFTTDRTLESEFMAWNKIKCSFPALRHIFQRE